MTWGSAPNSRMPHRIPDASRPTLRRSNRSFAAPPSPTRRCRGASAACNADVKILSTAAFHASSTALKSWMSMYCPWFSFSWARSSSYSFTNGSFRRMVWRASLMLPARCRSSSSRKNKGSMSVTCYRSAYRSRLVAGGRSADGSAVIETSPSRRAVLAPAFEQNGGLAVLPVDANVLARGVHAHRAIEAVGSERACDNEGNGPTVRLKSDGYIPQWRAKKTVLSLQPRTPPSVDTSSRTPRRRYPLQLPFRGWRRVR